MEKPIVAQIGSEMARPFIYDYCLRWNIPFDKDTEEEYGQAVLWMGAFYNNGLRAVIGLFVADAIPDELYIYGFYGDGTKHEKRPLLALTEFLTDLPYKKMYGFVHKNNVKMLRVWSKLNGKMLESEETVEGSSIVMMRGENNGKSWRRRNR